MNNLSGMERLVFDFLKELGEDPTREGLEKTPARVAKAYEYLTSGYHQRMEDVLNDALFTEEACRRRASRSCTSRTAPSWTAGCRPAAATSHSGRRCSRSIHGATG